MPKFTVTCRDNSCSQARVLTIEGEMMLVTRDNVLIIANGSHAMPKNVAVFCPASWVQAVRCLDP